MPDQEEFFDDVRDVSWVMGTCLGHPGTLFVAFLLLFFVCFAALHLDTVCWFYCGWLVCPCGIMDYCWPARILINTFEPELLPSQSTRPLFWGLKIGAWPLACSSRCGNMCQHVSVLQVGHCLCARWLSDCDEHVGGNFGGGSADGCNHGARADSCRLCKAGFLGKTNLDKIRRRVVAHDGWRMMRRQLV